jgi:Rrf2 family protein
VPLLPRECILAIVAVVDIAAHQRGGPVIARALTTRHRLAPRRLDLVLQALVRQRILKSVRGAGGGYKLARDPSRITIDDIFRAVRATKNTAKPPASSRSLKQVIMTVLIKAEIPISSELAHINIG